MIVPIVILLALAVVCGVIAIGLTVSIVTRLLDASDEPRALGSKGTRMLETYLAEDTRRLAEASSGR